MALKRLCFVRFADDICRASCTIQYLTTQEIMHSPYLHLSPIVPSSSAVKRAHNRELTQSQSVQLLHHSMRGSHNTPMALRTRFPQLGLPRATPATCRITSQHAVNGMCTPPIAGQNSADEPPMLGTVMHCLPTTFPSLLSSSVTHPPPSPPKFIPWTRPHSAQGNQSLSTVATHSTEPFQPVWLHGPLPVVRVRTGFGPPEQQSPPILLRQEMAAT